MRRLAIREEPADYEAPSRSARIVPLREPVQPAMPLHTHLPEVLVTTPPLPSLTTPLPLNDDDDSSLTDLEIRSLPYVACARLSERVLAQWMFESLGFNGALAFVCEHGCRAVLDALGDNFLYQDKWGRWRPAPRFRNPAGILRYQVRMRAPRQK